MQSDTASESPRTAITRDRRRISLPWLYLFLAIGLLPFLLALLRLLALYAPGTSGLTPIGDWLNQYLTLQWVSFEDRDVVLYALNLPIAALLIAVTRLTLGIRVLGFRSILIAIGIQEGGVVPSLLLILLIAGTVVLVRPSMRRAGMPLYARVAVVLSMVAFTILGALLTGAWFDSATLWSMAFFPVVILAMLAEGIADTVARDGVAMGAWRTATTIMLAGVLAVLNQLTPLRELLLSCPELLLTPPVMVIFISEFLDLRLLENFRPGSQLTPAKSIGPQIVLVRNRFPEPSPRRLTDEIPRRYRQASLQALIDQLRERGYTVHVLEADGTLPVRLRSLANTAFQPSGSGLFVLNYSGGIQGSGRLSQVPVICEILGIPHAGPRVEAAALSGNRQRQFDALQIAGIQHPTALSYDQARRLLQAGDHVLVVRPMHHADRGATKVSNVRRLRTVCERMKGRFGEIVIEQQPEGQAVTAIVLNPETRQRARVLSLLERTPGGFRREGGIQSECRDKLTRAAIFAASALGCCDIARVDLYCSESGDITVSRVLAVDPLTKRSATGVAASLNGHSLADIALHTMRSALARESTDHSRSTIEQTPTSKPHSTREDRSYLPCVTSA